MTRSEGVKRRRELLTGKSEVYREGGSFRCDPVRMEKNDKTLQK